MVLREKLEAKHSVRRVATEILVARTPTEQQDGTTDTVVTHQHSTDMAASRGGRHGGIAIEEAHARNPNNFSDTGQDARHGRRIEARKSLQADTVFGEHVTYAQSPRQP